MTRSWLSWFSAVAMGLVGLSACDFGASEFELIDDASRVGTGGAGVGGDTSGGGTDGVGTGGTDTGGTDTGGTDTGGTDTGGTDTGGTDTGGTDTGGAGTGGVGTGGVGTGGVGTGGVGTGGMGTGGDTGTPCPPGSVLVGSDCVEIPSCTSPITEPWSDSLDSEGSRWTSVHGDALVDTANNRLRLSHDDIVDRLTALPGSYYVSHQLTLSGGTVFTPYVLVDETLLPSIRRRGNDMQFGGDRYGTEDRWSDTEPIGFEGQLADGVLTAKVTTYLKAQAKQIAMKVEAGGNVSRSGWTTMSWPQTDVSTFRFVGQNNSAIYVGTDDYVYVGPLSGCSNMTDVHVEASYNR